MAKQLGTRPYSKFVLLRDTLIEVLSSLDAGGEQSRAFAREIALIKRSLRKVGVEVE